VSNAVPSWFELEDLLAAAGRLPVCNSAAKLHALVGRVVQSIQTGGDVVPAAEALASAAAASLADDPWVQFDGAARAFLARSLSATASSDPESPRAVPT
jgi:hypothetical protein